MLLSVFIYFIRNYKKNIFLIKIIIFIFSCFIYLIGCSKKQQGFDVLTDEEINDKKIILVKESIRWGVTPYTDIKTMKKYFRPFIDYLSEHLNKKVILYISKDFKDLAKDIMTGTIHVGTFAPAAFAEALMSEKFKKNIKYLATYSKISDSGENHDYYYGYIFVRADSNLKLLLDIKNKKFAFVDEKSSSGYKYPVAMLLKKGIIPHLYFKNTVFLGTHSRVMSAVFNGAVDVGATWDGEYFSENTLKKYGKNAFRIIIRTPKIPYDAIATSQQFTLSNSEDIKKISSILYGINLKSKTIDGRLAMDRNLGFPYSGLVKRNLKFYNVVKETIQFVHKYQKSLEKISN